MPPSVAIDAALVEEIILDLARFGAVGATGVARAVYTPEWVAATGRYAELCREAGLAVRVDAVGSVWGRLEGTEPGAQAIVSGSHVDSQLPGGRYDGALGAIAGLIAIRALKEQFGAPRRPLEAVALCEEEASRFPSAGFWGSRAITGRIGPDTPDEVRAYSGETIADAMRSVGLDPARIPEARRHDIGAFVELHIEQGPILEQAGLSVAVVTGITGIRHERVTLRGTENHAGAFPMDIRRDAMAGFCEIGATAIDTAHRWGRPAVTTIGRIAVSPNLTAAIPGQVTFSLDARHPDRDRFEALWETHRAMMREVARRRSLELESEVMLDLPPVPSDPGIVDALMRSAQSQGVPVMKMASGAGHDSQQIAAIAPVAMVFVRSKEGRSHTPEEFSSLADIVDGIRVLAGALHELAY